MDSGVREPDRSGRTRLPDGRELGWAEWGPVDGVPVLLCPGAATSRRLGAGTGVVGELGVRLISTDRPGLGVSDPLPGRGFADFAADMRALAGERELDRPAILGNSQGAPFAIACAVGGLVSAAALVSAADEVSLPEFADALPAELRDIVRLTTTDPAAAERLFAGMDADAMLAMVLGGSPEPDLAVYRSPTFAAAYREALDDAFGQGSAGYARDAALAMGRWPFDLARVSCPVDIWYGEQDSRHSPDLGARLTQRIPGARRTIVPGIGGAVLWTHTEAILRRLLAARG